MQDEVTRSLISPISITHLHIISKQSFPIIVRKQRSQEQQNNTRRRIKNSSNMTAVTANNVLLYVPNIIGYSRVICTVGSLCLMITVRESYWILAIILYLASFVGDLFDGLVARRLGQTSTYGGLLDMVTDRCSTLGLLFVLAIDYEDNVYLRLTFLLFCLLDISSHWCQMYSTSSLGKHHKSEDGNEGRHFLVRWFYKYYLFFGYLCVGAEFTYILAYVVQFTTDHWIHPILKITLWAVIPGCFLKQLVNAMQLTSACYAVAEYDAEIKNAEIKNK